MVILLIPLLVYGMIVTKEHYVDVARQLKLSLLEIEKETEIIDVQKFVIVLVDSLNKGSLKAINYARNIADASNISAFNVSTDTEQADKLREKWEQCKLPIPLIIKYASNRKILDPIAEYIESEEHQSKPGDIITVVMPQFVVGKQWENIYHNQTANDIWKRMIQDRHVAVVTVPYVLDK